MKKTWWNSISDSSKAIVVLALILFVTNIIAIVLVNVKTIKIADAVDRGFLQRLWYIFSLFNLQDLLIVFNDAIKTLCFILVNLIAYFVMYYIGKALGVIKTLAEFLGDIAEDGWRSRLILLYDLIGISFDVLTLCSFLSLI